MREIVKIEEIFEIKYTKIIHYSSYVKLQPIPKISENYLKTKRGVEVRFIEYFIVRLKKKETNFKFKCFFFG